MFVLGDSSSSRVIRSSCAVVVGLSNSIGLGRLQWYYNSFVLGDCGRSIIKSYSFVLGGCNSTAIRSLWAIVVVLKFVRLGQLW